MSSQVYYHFTTEMAWQRILKKGLVPQPLKTFHDEMHSMCDDLGIKDHTGVYVWPEVSRSLLRDFFLFKQVHERDVESGILLEVQLDPVNLLGHQWLAWVDRQKGSKNSLKQTHTLAFTLADGSIRQDHKALMDVCLKRIPPKHIRRVARIYQQIEPVDNFSLAADLGLTS